MVALGTLSRRLLACLNLALDKKDLPYKKGMFRAMIVAKVAENHQAEWSSTWYL